MNSKLKRILLSVAKLPRSDRNWLLKQLSVAQLQQFKELDGYKLLKNARKFRKLPDPQLPQCKESKQLPKMCQKLGEKDPFFIAIILEQGHFDWEHSFLETCLAKDKICDLRETQVTFLKPGVKSHIFQQWQTQFSFDEHLESAHG